MLLGRSAVPVKYSVKILGLLTPFGINVISTYKYNSWWGGGGGGGGASCGHFFLPKHLFLRIHLSSDARISCGHGMHV